MKGLATLLVSVTLAVSSDTAIGGAIRTVHVNAERMVPIYLSLGQSTVIRFSEKPVKVVVGNQNYFRVEFIEKDITIQPQGDISTNLFVYTERGHVYGFLLKLGGGQYDDLINARWNYPKKATLEDPDPDHLTRKIDLTLSVRGGLEAKFSRIRRDRTKGRFILDGAVRNGGPNQVPTSDLKFSVSRGGKTLPKIVWVFAKDTIPSGAKIQVRVFIGLDKGEAFTLHMRATAESGQAIISKGWL